MPPKTSKTPGPSQSLLRPVPQAASSPDRVVAARAEVGASPALKSDVAELKSELVRAVKDEIRAALEEFRSSMHMEIQTLRADIVRDNAALRSEFTDLRKNVSEVEQSLSAYSDEVVGLQAKVNFLTTELSKLDAKCETLESMSRRQNLRLLGVSEAQPSSTTSVSQLLKEAFNLDECPEIDRSHRSLAPTPKHGDPPRPIIARMHYFKDCELILKKAREMKQINIHGMRISVYPDYTAKVAKARSAFNDVRRDLRGLDNVKYSLLFPARLRVTHGNQQHVFTSAEEAKRFVASITK